MGDASHNDSLTLLVSFLTGAVHEWWIVFKESDDAQLVQIRKELRNELVSSFDILNKKKIARNELVRLGQFNNVPTFNDYCQWVLLDIPTINKKEQLDRHTRRFESSIWKELYAKDYKELFDAMRDRKTVEAAHRRIETRTGTQAHGSEITPRIHVRYV